MHTPSPPPNTSLGHCGVVPCLCTSSQILRPFLLGRDKLEVASDLPQKVEKTIRCQISAWQTLWYRRIEAAEVHSAVVCGAQGGGWCPKGRVGVSRMNRRGGKRGEGGGRGREGCRRQGRGWDGGFGGSKQNRLSYLGVWLY